MTVRFSRSLTASVSALALLAAPVVTAVATAPPAGATSAAAASSRPTGSVSLVIPRARMPHGNLTASAQTRGSARVTSVRLSVVRLDGPGSWTDVGTPRQKPRVQVSSGRYRVTVTAHWTLAQRAKVTRESRTVTVAIPQPTVPTRDEWVSHLRQRAASLLSCPVWRVTTANGGDLEALSCVRLTEDMDYVAVVYPIGYRSSGWDGDAASRFAEGLADGPLKGTDQGVFIRFLTNDLRPDVDRWATVVTYSPSPWRVATTEAFHLHGWTP